jgi:site-specific DNA-methyltransferase (adenine-specific)
MGCEITKEYNEWAIKRLENVIQKTKIEWIEWDRANDKRRTSIR